MRAILLFIVLVYGLLAQRPLGTIAERNPRTTAADAALGAKLFVGKCGHCHGQSGEGGRGAVLNTGRFRRGDSDRELFVTIRRGVPNTEMPGTNSTETEIWQIVTHLRQLARQGAADEPVTGDALAGAAVYKKTACAQCHTIGDEGGHAGPDLTDAGAQRAVRHLRQSLVDPGADVPLNYRTVSVTTLGGQTIDGIHLNEDEYSVHLRDLSGVSRSFLKRELKEVILPRRSLMPAYASLAKPDLENLVAYLHSLRPDAGGAVWRFDRLDSIGGHKTELLGEPRIVDTPIGKAVEFDGVDDAMFVANHPLAGADAFTLEAIYRPDGGAFEQRWFHLSETNPATGADTENRMLFEIRVTGNQWYLDSFHQAGNVGKALMNKAALHPLGEWHHVASVYDGKEFRNYVNGVQEGAAAVFFSPHGPGRTSIGVRINKVFFFKGAVHSARFTKKALDPGEFLKIPEPKR